MQILGQIAKLRERLDELLKGRETAEAEMQQLKGEALTAGNFKENVEQERRWKSM